MVNYCALILEGMNNMKKVIITLLVLLSIIIATLGLFYIRFLNLDKYKWNTSEDILSFEDKQYKCEPGGESLNLKLEKQIGKVEEESSFRIWAIKGESTEDRIAITGFMYPTNTYRRIR